MTLHVEGLYTYPIKSCGGISHQEVNVTDWGLEHDREFMVVGSKGQFLSQRTHPELALVQTKVEDSRLMAAAPGIGELIIPLDTGLSTDPEPVTVWRRTGKATDQGKTAADFFSSFLKRQARLMRIVDPRPVKLAPDMAATPGISRQTGFADGYPFLLASLGSLAELNRHISNNGHDRIDIVNFRPNIVIDCAPYEEDFWREIQIGPMRTIVSGACARCPVPNVDPLNGVLPPPAERTVSQVLRATRAGIDLVAGEEGVFFGQNLTHIPQPGLAIKLGDEVKITDQRGTRNITLG